eukprot:scaffold96698_cov31-Tisochrysis_lutea.AAC.2
MAPGQHLPPLSHEQHRTHLACYKGSRGRAAVIRDGPRAKCTVSQRGRLRPPARQLVVAHVEGVIRHRCEQWEDCGARDGCCGREARAVHHISVVEQPQVGASGVRSGAQVVEGGDEVAEGGVGALVLAVGPVGVQVAFKPRVDVCGHQQVDVAEHWQHRGS